MKILTLKCNHCDAQDGNQFYLFPLLTRNEYFNKYKVVFLARKDTGKCNYRHCSQI